MWTLRASALAIALCLPGVAGAQTTEADHEAHHPAPAAQGTAPPATTAPTPSPPTAAPSAGSAASPLPATTQGMQMSPEQCRSAMANMPPACLGMMQGGMMQGMGASPSQSTTGVAADLSPAGQAYLAAMAKSDLAMMAGARDKDADVAFVKSMIPHHQAALDMARAVMTYGKDETVKNWAANILRDQQREIDEMTAWLPKDKP